MAENYREQQQEEAEGIVDAGGFENDPGTGMIAEDQETAQAAEEQTGYATADETQPIPYDEAAEAPEYYEEQSVDLHEDNGSGVDIAVVIIVLLIIIAGLAYAIWNSMNEPAPQLVAQQQSLQELMEEESTDEPPYPVVELPEGVALVVNGTEIPETDIDQYVAEFRKAYGLENDDDWAEWMIAYGYTPESLRNMSISAFAERTLVENAIAELGIQVSEERAREIFDATRAEYETEEEWQQALEESSLTEEEFYEQCERQTQQEELLKILGDSAVSAEQEDADTLEYVKSYYPEYAEAESLDGIPAEVVDPIREMVQYYAQQDAYAEFLASAQETGTIEMSAMPKDVPYNVNMLGAYFKSITDQLAQGSQSSQASAQ